MHRIGEKRMSLLSGIVKAVKKGASAFSLGNIKKALPAVASIATGGVGGVLIGAGAELLGGGGSGSGMMNVQSTAPQYSSTANLPEPGMGGTLARLLPGGDTGYLSRGKYKAGKLSGQPIPHGFHEKMSPQGTIYLVKARRRRGITYRDLATYRRVHRTLKTYAKKTR